MKKVILCMLLVSGLFANNIWNQEYGAGKTYTSIVNDKNVDFRLKSTTEESAVIPKRRSDREAVHCRHRNSRMRNNFI